MRKLIRDGIPALIMEERLKTNEALDHAYSGIRKMSDWEYPYALRIKLDEEWAEVWEKPSAEELGDCLEVLMAAAAHFGIDWSDVEKERVVKSETRGGFFGKWELSKK